MQRMIILLVTNTGSSALGPIFFSCFHLQVFGFFLSPASSVFPFLTASCVFSKLNQNEVLFWLLICSNQSLNSLLPFKIKFLLKVVKLCFNYVHSLFSSLFYPKGGSKSAAAKSLQSCPTLCNPRDGSPPGSPIPGILQARTLEWVAISFNAWKWKLKVKSLSHVQLFRDPMDCNLPGSSIHGIFQASTGVGCHCLLKLTANLLCHPRVSFSVFIFISLLATHSRAGHTLLGIVLSFLPWHHMFPGCPFPL